MGPPTLIAGDVLLYRPALVTDGLLPWTVGNLITMKTWTKVSHCEVYAGGGISMAARYPTGVNRYPVRLEGLGYVMRPRRRLKFGPAMVWYYEKAHGQKYDLLGLMAFTRFLTKGAEDRMFCSEFVSRFFSEGLNLPLFERGWSHDRVAPSMLLAAPALVPVWTDGGTM